MRKIAIFEITLYSEAVFGGDGEQIGLVDIDIQADEYGLPYYAGRTLKGVLREQAEWYNSCLPKGERFDRELDNLFGKSHEDNLDSLRFGDAKLSDSIYDYIKQNKIDARQVLFAMTDVRSMTSIDKTGKAEAGSLRQVRVMKAGFKLYAPMFISNRMSDREKELLEKATKLVRHIGLMRHRGKGEVSCNLIWDSYEAVAKKEIGERKSTASRSPYYELTIHTEEPLKISHVIGTSDSSHALNYIPGYVLRGALVHAYLQSTGKDLHTEDVFNGQNVQFWNGYLSLDGQRSLPFPQHIFEPKDQARKDHKTRETRDIFNRLDKEHFDGIRHLSPVRVSRHAAVFRDTTIMAGKVKTKSSLHLSIHGSNNRQVNTVSRRTQIYRYEAIAAEQTFKSIVYLKGEHDFARWLNSQSKLTLWLGGARNSGYGRTVVTIQQLDQSPEQPIMPQAAGEEHFYVMATSDWIIRDQHGRLANSLDADWLGSKLGVKLQLCGQIINTQLSGGYISLWKAYQPAINAIQAGSILKYEIKEGTIDREKLLQVMERGVGSRVNEGFGRLIFLTQWPFKQLLDQDHDFQYVSSIIRGRDEESELQLQILQKNLAAQQMLEQTRERVANWIKNVNNNRLKSSQWGKLWQVASDALATFVREGNFESAKDRWDIFWRDVNSKKSRTRAYSQVIVCGKRLDEFINEQLAYEYELAPYLPKVGQLMHEQWNLRALNLFCQQMIRSRKYSRKEGDAS